MATANSSNEPFDSQNEIPINLLPAGNWLTFDFVWFVLNFNQKHKQNPILERELLSARYLKAKKQRMNC